ncbi:hypothetical protein DFJ74DRAFT_686719 [Hyaloraphidium curvatum]|nr:hypothetical protein DFJ74DRAFT_686719 [Hyaloraphidium curvatum]
MPARLPLSMPGFVVALLLAAAVSGAVGEVVSNIGCFCTSSCGGSLFHWTPWCKTAGRCGDWYDPLIGTSYYWDECDNPPKGCLCHDNRISSYSFVNKDVCYGTCRANSGSSSFTAYWVTNGYTEVLAAPDPCAGVSCSGHGRCSGGSCTCDSGYVSSGSTSCVEKPRDPCDGVSCSGHGRCSGGSCTCDSGYVNSGSTSCVEQIRNPCDGVSCSGHGRCSGGSCTCDSGYVNSGSTSCVERIRDPCEGVGCSGHGRCESDLCHCDPGFARSSSGTECNANAQAQPVTITSAGDASSSSGLPMGAIIGIVVGVGVAAAAVVGLLVYLKRRKSRNAAGAQGEEATAKDGVVKPAYNKSMEPAVAAPPPAYLPSMFASYGNRADTSIVPVKTFGVASSAYTPAQDDEITMVQGDRIYVDAAYSDGWARGFNARTGEEGLFPADFVAVSGAIGSAGPGAVPERRIVAPGQ